MITTMSIAEQFTAEQRKGICKWCVDNKKTRCTTCALNRTEPYKEKK